MKITRKTLSANRSFAVVCARARRGITLRRCADALLLAGIFGSAFSTPQGLLRPAQLIADSGLPPATRAASEYVARQYTTFWNTGNEALVRAALTGDFIDKASPEERRRRPEGVVLASGAFRQTVSGLHCDVEQMIVAGNRVISHLRFHGRFTGTFGTRKGKGQSIDFVATDIYQISGGKITTDQHIEDSLTLMKQLGAQ